jgi:hypothetical protein
VQVFVVVATLAGVVLTAMAVSKGTSLAWTPWSDNPFG